MSIFHFPSIHLRDKNKYVAASDTLHISIPYTLLFFFSLYFIINF